MADLRADLLSGDATKQTGALMNTFAMLVGAGLSLCCAAGAGAVMLLRDAWAAADGRQRCSSDCAAMTVGLSHKGCHVSAAACHCWPCATCQRSPTLAQTATQPMHSQYATLVQAAGRDVSPYVSVALQLLGNPATAVEPKRIAYDLALTAQLSDTGGVLLVWWCGRGMAAFGRFAKR